MKISEVEALFKTFRETFGDLEVVLSKDVEGNGYSPLAGTSIGHYEPDSTYSGEFTDPDDEDYVQGSSNAVVLWPTN